MNGINISEDTLLILNLGTMFAAFGIYGRIIYRAAALELTQKFQEKQLNAAFEKIRDLEKRLKNG